MDNPQIIYIFFGVGITIPIMCSFYKSGGDKRKSFDHIMMVFAYSLITFTTYPLVLGWMISHVLLNVNTSDDKDEK